MEPKKITVHLGMVVHICKPGIWELRWKDFEASQTSHTEQNRKLFVLQFGKQCAVFFLDDHCSVWVQGSEGCCNLFASFLSSSSVLPPRSCYVTRAGFELMTLIPLPPKCWARVPCPVTLVPLTMRLKIPMGNEVVGHLLLVAC